MIHFSTMIRIIHIYSWPLHYLTLLCMFNLHLVFSSSPQPRRRRYCCSTYCFLFSFGCTMGHAGSLVPRPGMRPAKYGVLTTGPLGKPMLLDFNHQGSEAVRAGLASHKTKMSQILCGLWAPHVTSTHYCFSPDKTLSLTVHQGTAKLFKLRYNTFSPPK